MMVLTSCRDSTRPTFLDPGLVHALIPPLYTNCANILYGQSLDSKLWPTVDNGIVFKHSPIKAIIKDIFHG